ncbi:hypothetical protein GQ53DRAFT_44295 [Thozetella sp. PMI_491]|nr:hypothetical protein GQ53DRAFT_44295 [Thozetella sp. PMI_491]
MPGHCFLEKETAAHCTSRQVIGLRGGRVWGLSAGAASKRRSSSRASEPEPEPGGGVRERERARHVPTSLVGLRWADANANPIRRGFALRSGERVKEKDCEALESGFLRGAACDRARENKNGRLAGGPLRAQNGHKKGSIGLTLWRETLNRVRVSAARQARQARQRAAKEAGTAHVPPKGVPFYPVAAPSTHLLPNHPPWTIITLVPPRPSTTHVPQCPLRASPPSPASARLHGAVPPSLHLCNSTHPSSSIFPARAPLLSRSPPTLSILSLLLVPLPPSSPFNLHHRRRPASTSRSASDSTARHLFSIVRIAN